jgi:hypothetical protein
MRHIVAIASALGLFAALSAPGFAATPGKTSELGSITVAAAKAKKPTAAQCKKNPKMKGCADMEKHGALSSTTLSAASKAKKPTAAQCKKNPKMKGCPAPKAE